MSATRSASLAHHHWNEWQRTRSGAAAYDCLRAAGVYLQMSRKLERLIRRHRARVFDDQAGDAHHRAVTRLKRTVTYQAQSWERHYDAMLRHGERLTRMGY